MSECDPSHNFTSLFYFLSTTSNLIADPQDRIWPISYIHFLSQVSHRNPTCLSRSQSTEQTGHRTTRSQIPSTLLLVLGHWSPGFYHHRHLTFIAHFYSWLVVQSYTKWTPAIFLFTRHHHDRQSSLFTHLSARSSLSLSRFNLGIDSQSDLLSTSLVLRQLSVRIFFWSRFRQDPDNHSQGLLLLCERNRFDRRLHGKSDPAQLSPGL